MKTAQEAMRKKKTLLLGRTLPSFGNKCLLFYSLPNFKIILPLRRLKNYNVEQILFESGNY